MFAGRCRKPDKAPSASGSPSRKGSGRAAKEFVSVDRTVRSTDGLLIQPFECNVVLRQLVSHGVLIPRVADRRYPLAERQQQLAINQIAHIHRAVRNVVLHIVQLMQVSPAIGLRDARPPALAPRGDRVLKNDVALAPYAL